MKSNKKVLNYFKVRILKATPLLFAWGYESPFHANMIGKVILVRNTPHDGAYFECKTGESILKQDVERIAKS